MKKRRSETKNKENIDIDFIKTSYGPYVVYNYKNKSENKKS